ncbi:hypothetical protein DSM106972_014990 [Dulcicalothrix desertica PCC 7102]|uniref:Uncharacterized protein n=2 Tax=Dulcicalothrix desertica TaxID=32056 RepID=A0A3S1BAU8_9CYAN|nr:hypothetical protein DSM106972_014990 [Dulcicalothrix desertica PCC 7102]
MDENIDPVYFNQLRRQKPDLTVWAVGEPNTPAKGTLDPEILYWCEEHDFVLVTNNRKSMPVQLNDHIAEGHHMPDIFILNPNLSVGDNLEELILLAEYSFENEYQDQVVHLPIT